MAYNIDPQEIKKVRENFEEIREGYKKAMNDGADVEETLKSQGQENNAKTTGELRVSYEDRIAEINELIEKTEHLEKVASREELL